MKTRKGVSDEKRMLIIQEYFDGASKNSLCRKYKLSNSRTISNSLRIFGIEDTRTTYIPRVMNKKANHPENESEELKQLRQELKQSRLDLKRESMRADLYETMVDVAEEIFNILIRKKADTNQ